MELHTIFISEEKFELGWCKDICNENNTMHFRAKQFQLFFCFTQHLHPEMLKININIVSK